MFNDTWISSYTNDGLSNFDLYYLACYWAVQTVTTVGYGDVSCMNSTERLFCSFMMVIGVLAFSFANGSFASIIQNYDLQNNEYRENKETLERIYQEFMLPLDLYNRIKKSINYETQHDI
jgi:hypothetical protein